MTSADPRAPDGPPLNGVPVARQATVTRLPGREVYDRAQGWLRNAMIALAVLAAAAAVVSWDAQYLLVRSVKHIPAAGSSRSARSPPAARQARGRPAPVPGVPARAAPTASGLGRRAAALPRPRPGASGPASRPA